MRHNTAETLITKQVFAGSHPAAISSAVLQLRSDTDAQIGRHLQVAQGILDDVVAQAAHQIHVEQVVEAEFAGGRRLRAGAHGPGLNLGHVHVAKCKHAQRLE